MKDTVLIRSSNNISIATLYENFKMGKYNLDPACQRKSIWSEEKKSFLINSILRNFPIPPVFLRQHINDNDGTTTYDVIDGKQRITSIIEFIEGKIVVSSEDDEDYPFDGLSFGDFNDNEELLDYKKNFWKYSISIEYVDTTDDQLIDSIFDRLNRNGEALTGQELRNAKYHSSKLLTTVDELSQMQYWKERLQYVDRSRMEDLEFISELIYFIIAQQAQTSNQTILDQFYKRCESDTAINWDEVKTEFKKLTGYIEKLNIDYERYKVKGVSHLYAFWGLARNAIIQGKSAEEVKTRIDEFFQKLRSKETMTQDIEDYKVSMCSRTKDVSMRQKRINCISQYCLQ